MRIQWLALKNFRNYLSFESSFSPELNILIGLNAQGKTNLIEALYLIGTTKSFRKAEQEFLIKINEKNAWLKALIIKNDLEKEIIFKFNEQKRKEIMVNNKKINKLTDYIGNVNISLFSPDDLGLIKGDASFRRKFLDMVLCQTNKHYLADLIRYQRVIKQRNVILKEIKNGSKKIKELEPWNEQLVNYSFKICLKRNELCNNINIIANKFQKIIKNTENLTIKYIDSLWKGERPIDQEMEPAFKHQLGRIEQEEIIRGTTLLGPHRDNLMVCINDMNTREFASQGQQRSAAISMRMAEVEYIKGVAGEYPILLLDDIFSELDDTRKTFLNDYLDQGIQIFLTGTREQDFKTVIRQAAVYQIHNGTSHLVSEGSWNRND